MVKNPLAMQETWVQSLGWEDPPKEGMATHSSIFSLVESILFLLIENVQQYLLTLMLWIYYFVFLYAGVIFVLDMNV